MALDIQNLTKYYKTTLAVDEVSISVADGEIVGLLGPNGAGKTTIMRCVTGIVQATHGEILVDGLSLRKREQDVKRRLAFVPEVPNPYEMLTVVEHLRFAAMAYDTEPIFDSRHEELLRRFELHDRRNDLVLSLSKGMKQKLAIICAFMHDAKVLLFDEPLIGIDPKGVRELKDMIVEARANGCAILIGTHMLDTAERLCDRIVILRQGRKIAEGDLDDLQERAKMGEDATLEDVFLTLTEVDTADEGPGVPSA
ncbi:MAG: ABC transporter ATP-binding protein [Armatimonadota bacterium]|nr:ABC transporter ATP-binding protein [Armatimonadota bacterium]